MPKREHQLSAPSKSVYNAVCHSFDVLVYSNFCASGRWCSTWKAARIMCSGTPLWAQRLSVTTLSGTFGAGSNLCVKAVLEMLGTEGLWQCLTRLPFYITGVATVVLCALQLLYLNLALFR